MTTPTIVLDPYDYGFQNDPYPVYRALREHAPLYHNEEHGFWALSRYADVAAAIRDSETYSNGHGVSLDPMAWGPHAWKAMSIVALDPPQHTRLRSLVSRGFTPRRVQELRATIVALADACLDEAVPKERFDFVADVAGRVPMDVISQLVGVPPADRPELRRLADVLVHRDELTRDVPPAGMDAAVTLFGYYADLLAERRRRPREDLTSALIAAETDEGRLTDEEIIAFLFLLIVAGNETTTKLLGNALFWACRFPDQLALVTADRSRIPAWVEETLRFDASTQLLARYLLRDVELHGRRAPAGSQLVLLLGSANRDPDAFPDPDRYDIGRDTSRLISFGAGRHFCLGASLARLEAQLVLDRLLSRVRHLAVEEDGAERVHSVNVRGFAALPVVVTAR